MLLGYYCLKNPQNGQNKNHRNEKCCRNGLRLIAMAWEMFGGFVPETRIMIRKIVIRHADKHNRP
jgi:hypothetical protein